MARFQPGQSGNPRGRPRNRPDRRTRFRRSLEDGAGEVVEAILAKARAGDTEAARLVLDRTVPKLRPADVPVRVGAQEDSLSAQAEAVVAEVMAGRITPEQAQTLTTCLSAVARLKEVEELETRLLELERRAGIHEST